MITSTGNAQVRAVSRLMKKKKERDQQDLFVTEGIKMAREVPPERVAAVYVSDSFEEEHRSEAWLRRYRYEVVSDSVMRAMADTQTPQGVLCLVRQYHYSLDDLLAASGSRAPLLLALENLQDPGNLGTIVRTAEGAGVSGILLSEDCVDIYNPKVIRSTMGSVYRVPFCYAPDFQAALKHWQAAGVRLYAAHLKGAVCYDQCDYTAPAAFLIGNESRGLSDLCAAVADQNIKIPMEGQVESLNAAVAAAVLMYEAARQRRTLHR